MRPTRTTTNRVQAAGVLAAARAKGQQEVAEYLFSQFIEDMKKRFGYEPEVMRKAADDTSE